MWFWGNSQRKRPSRLERWPSNSGIVPERLVSASRTDFRIGKHKQNRESKFVAVSSHLVVAAFANLESLNEVVPVISRALTEMYGPQAREATKTFRNRSRETCIFWLKTV